MAGRSAAPPATREDRDLLDVLMSLRDPEGQQAFSADEITGMFISMMFAGHHTTSGTAAWTLIELLRNRTIPDRIILDRIVADRIVRFGIVADGDVPDGDVPDGDVADGDVADGIVGDRDIGDASFLDAIVRELEGLGDQDISFQALREIPLLESAIKEALRLHPPLILLLRAATRDLSVLDYEIPAGALVGATPAISNRIAADFPDPDRFDPGRYAEARQEDLINRWTWIPFGAGRHRCVGANFAMIQLKAIFSVLLRDWTFELAQPPDSYRNDHSKMVVQLAQPCVVRYRRRDH